MFKIAILKNDFKLLKFSNLFKVIIFICFGFMAINCEDHNKNESDNSPAQERTDDNSAQERNVTPAQERQNPAQARQAVTPAQERQNPAQARQAVTPAQKNKDVDDFVLRNIEGILPEGDSPVQENKGANKLVRTIEKPQDNQIILRNRATGYNQPAEPRTTVRNQHDPPRTPEETRTTIYSEYDEGSILVIPVGELRGLKISSTKLAKELEKFDHYDNTRLYDFSFSQYESSLWNKVKYGISNDFLVSFSIETAGGVFDYECNAKVVRPRIRMNFFNLIVENPQFYLNLASCSNRWLKYRIRMQNIVFDEEQFESLKAIELYSSQ